MHNSLCCKEQTVGNIQETLSEDSEAKRGRKGQRPGGKNRCWANPTTAMENWRHWRPWNHCYGHVKGALLTIKSWNLLCLYNILIAWEGFKWSPLSNPPKSLWNVLVKRIQVLIFFFFLGFNFRGFILGFQFYILQRENIRKRKPNRTE